MRSTLLVVGTLAGITALCLVFVHLIHDPSAQPSAATPTEDAPETMTGGGPAPASESGGAPESGTAAASAEGEPAAAGTAATAATTDDPRPETQTGKPFEFGDLHVSGTVSAPDGRPLAGVEVLAFPRSGRRKALEELRAQAKEDGATPPLGARTDEEGAFRIEKLPGGKLWLQVRLEGYYADPGNERWFDAGTEGVHFVLHPGSTVRGTVRDSEGNAISAVLVKATRSRMSLGDYATDSAKTEQDGTYELAAVPDGTVTVSAVHQDWAPESIPLEIELGETLEGIDFVLEEGLSITGRVVDPGGTPIAAASVSVQPARSEGGFDHTKSRSAETDIDGTFLVRGLEPGLHQLRASHADHLSGEGKSVAAGEAEVEIILEKAVTLSGSVYTPAGKPASRAQVIATVGAGRSANPWNSHESSSASETDEEGRFDLRGLKPGKVEVRAEMVDYRESESLSLELQGGGSTEEIELHLREGVAISGSVVDQAGKPVGGAIVGAAKTEASSMGWGGARAVAMAHGPGGGDAELSPGSARTDDGGAFSIKGLSKGGLYHVTAGKKGFVDPNAELKAENTEAPAGGLVIVLARAASISGIVRSPDGEPIEDAQISLMKKGKQLWAGGFAGHASSEQDGAFEMDSVAEGGYSLFANHDDYRISESLELSLAMGEHREGIELLLQVGGEIRGQVTDEDGEPISGANIRGGNMAAMMSGKVDWVNANSGADGSFAIKGVGPGTYSLTCTADGYVDEGSSSWGSTMAGGGDGYTASAGDFIVLKMSKGATLTGRVVDESNQPVTSYEVQVMVSQPQMRGQEWPGAAENVTDLDGRFEIAGLDGNVKSLVITADGYAKKHIELNNFRPDEYHDIGQIQLSKGATLKGRVVAADGTKVEGAEVAVRRTGAGADAATMQMMGFGGVESSKTDEQGEFTIDSVPPGPHRLTATHPQFATAQLEVDVPEKGERTGLHLTMAVGGVVTGLVTGAEGKPLSGIAITAMPLAAGAMTMGENAKNTQTDAEGRYRLGGLLEGQHMVSARLQVSGGGFGFSQRTRTVDVPAAGEVVCDFIEGQLCRLYGKVRGWDAEAATAAGPQNSMLVLFSTTGGGINQSMSQIQESGSFSFEPMPPGNYQIMIFGATTFSVAIPEAPEYRNDIELPGAGIKGQVARADGETVGMIEIRALRRESGSLLSRFAQSMTDADGNYEFKWLQDGIYDVYAEVSGYGTGTLEGVDVTGGRVVVGADVVISEGNVLTVTVKKSDGSPEPSASVLLHDSRGNPVNTSGRFGMSGGGNEAGEQEVADVPPGTYRVIVGSSEGTMWRDGVVVGSGAAAVEVTLPGHRGKLQVVVTRSGAPVEGVSVELFDSADQLVIDMSTGFMAMLGGGSTGADGQFTTGFLPTGPYRLRASGPGGEVVEQPIAIPADDSTLELSLSL